jgi:hypothetical protein
VIISFHPDTLPIHKSLDAMIKKNIATNEFGFVFNPATGDSYSSNPIAAEIIQMMKDNLSLNEIKKKLLDKYEVDKMTIEKDVDEFAGILKENNLLNN